MSRVRVRLKTAAVRLAFDGEQEVFERHVEPLLLGLARTGRPAPGDGQPASAASAPAHPAAPVAVPTPAPGYAPPSGSFGTFQRQLDPEPEDPGQRIAAYAFFLWNYEKKERFRDDEVRGCFAAEGRDAPSDMADAYEALQARRILEPAGDGAWRLTPRGLSRVRKHLR